MNRSGSVWWKEAVVYEILVPSFQDSNGDGMGDLPGIIQRLDYLKELSVGALWLSPFYKTEFFDIGYDVSDYCDVDPRFGTLDDFKQLLEEAHARNIRIIIDYVPNHTSNKHPWFLQSRESRSNRYRDYYLWSDPAPDGGAPNNWINRFGLSAWTYDEPTGQYYFATFAPEQPDLNWRNPAVVEEMFRVLRFWLDMGVDGIRMDAMAHLVKDRHLRRNPRDPYYNEKLEPSNKLQPMYSQNQPELLRVIFDVKQIVSHYRDRVFMGEVFLNDEQISIFQRAGADLLLSTSLLQAHFDHVNLQLNIDHLEATTAQGAWPARASGDHDLKRLASRLPPERWRMAAVLQLTLRGTPTMYYGEELGLKDSPVPHAQMVDPSGRANPRYSRDPYRAPMPWTDDQYAGFSTAKPWLPIDEDTLSKNVASQESDPESLLNFYRRLMKLRAGTECLKTGHYTPLDPPEDVLAFRRGDESDGMLVALNFRSQTVTWPLPSKKAKVIFSTHARSTCCSDNEISIEPNEGVIFQLRPND
ncbi:MAG: alpha-amylase family glycosyl hydrolase [Aureliella sp.]